MSPVPPKPFDIKNHEPPRVDIYGYNLLPKKKPQIMKPSIVDSEVGAAVPSSKKQMRATTNIMLSRRNTAAAAIANNAATI
jgi:hypothetical protein